MKWQILWLALAACCIAYGFLVLSVGSGNGFFLVWFLGGSIFLLCFFFARKHLWQTLPHSLRTGLIIAVAAGFAVFAFTEARIIRAFRNTPEAGLDYIIVLGAQVRENGPSVVLQYRLDTAADYLRDNPSTICIVSGGQGYNEPVSEAVAMRDYLVARGIDETRIRMESASKNTVENMEFSKVFFDPAADSVGIVTNNFHLFRACGIARKSGIEHISAILAPSTPLYLPNNLLREFLGVVKDTLAGNLV